MHLHKYDDKAETSKNIEVETNLHYMGEERKHKSGLKCLTQMSAWIELFDDIGVALYYCPYFVHTLYLALMHAHHLASMHFYSWLAC